MSFRMAIASSTAIKLATLAVILGGLLIRGVQSRWGEWSEGRWLQWLSRLLVILGSIAVGVLVAIIAERLLPDTRPLRFFIQGSSLGVSAVYALGQLVEFALGPMGDDLATPQERSPFYVSSYVWVFAAWVEVVVSLLAMNAAYSWFPAARILVLLLGTVAFILAAFPPDWARPIFEAPPSLGPVAGRIVMGLFGLAMLGLGVLGSAAQIDSWLRH